ILTLAASSLVDLRPLVWWRRILPAAATTAPVRRFVTERHDGLGSERRRAVGEGGSRDWNSSALLAAHHSLGHAILRFCLACGCLCALRFAGRRVGVPAPSGYRKEAQGRRCRA